MTIRRLNHIQITIPAGQEDAGRAFYCDLLGLQEIEKPDALKANGGFWMMLADTPIHVGVEADFDRSITKAHLAYEVDDLAFWRDKLENAGIHTENNTPIPGFDRFMCRDPFGNRVEFIQLLTDNP